MPDSHPPIFDDGGGLPDVDRRDRHENEESGDRFGDLRPPNYLVRRAVVVGLAVAVIAGGSVAVSSFLGDDDGGSGDAFTTNKWDTVVSVDAITGSIVLTDDKGEEQERFRLGIQPLDESRLLGTTLVGATDEELSFVSLDDIATVTTIDIGAGDGLLRPSGSAHTVITRTADADRAVFLHGPSSEVIDTGTLDAIIGARYDVELARSDSSGRHVLVTDSGNFQSVLFSFDRDTPSFFPGLALAVDDSLVVTAQNVGADATVSVFNHDGEPGTSARTQSVRAGMLVDGGVIVVTVDGDVVRIALEDGSIEEAGDLTIGTVLAGHVAVRGDRLVVIGEAGTAVVDDTGEVLVDLPGAAPVGSAAGEQDIAPRNNDCLIVERAELGEIVVIDLADGTILAEALADGEVLTGTDGCRPVVPTTSGYLVVTADGVLRATTSGDVIALSPDGRTLVVDRDNRLELLPVVTEDNETIEDEPIDIGRSGRAVLFADL